MVARVRTFRAEPINSRGKLAFRDVFGGNKYFNAEKNIEKEF
jgi:hypothetical protein